jgi:hypothetical protein
MSLGGIPLSLEPSLIEKQLKSLLLNKEIERHE